LLTKSRWSINVHRQTLLDLPPRTILAGLLLLVACRAPTKPPAELEEFPVGSPSVGASFAREYVGQVQATRYVEFRARHKGVIERVGVDEGKRARKGQLLFAISAKELRQEVAKARAAVESAAAELKAARVEAGNTRLLVENKVSSRTELDAAEARLASLEAKVREAEAEADRAEVDLSLARIHAPFSGVVNRIPRKVGSLVLEDELLTTLTDTSEVFVYFRVSEQEYLAQAARVGAGRREPVSLVLADGTPYAHPGFIDTVESEFDKETGNISFRARFPNPQGLLRHGATGKIVIRSEDPAAVVVPQSSTFEIQEHLYVYTVAPDGVVHATLVTPRARTKVGLVLESGLDATARIVLEGAQRLKDGARIIAKAAPSPVRPQ
jgi:membrane fusion protein (multidrug efflux system)